MQDFGEGMALDGSETCIVRTGYGCVWDAAAYADDEIEGAPMNVGV